jgi:hypothetical protein
MMINPIEYKHDLVGKPLKEFLRRMGPSSDWTDESVLTALYLAGVTAAVNLLPAATLIQSGVRGERYFTGLSIGSSKLGYPMPLFNYVTPASKAARAGARVGGKVGARVAGRLIPGVGWALLAYDVYDIAANRSLWGFDLS